MNTSLESDGASFQRLQSGGSEDETMKAVDENADSTAEGTTKTFIHQVMNQWRNEWMKEWVNEDVNTAEANVFVGQPLSKY